MNDQPIGVFDSGVGGLSILREMMRVLPSENLLYVADQANVPYGHRQLEEVRGYSEEISRFLLSRRAKAIVVACNTASAAALQYLRVAFPHVPFVGMEPAVKPAAQQSLRRTIGVIATQATFQGPLFASVVDRFAGGVRVLAQTCPGLVEQIEAGKADSRESRRILEERLQPLLREQIDSLVLGCTHYPFAVPVIREIVGPGVAIVDPSRAVARQVGRVLAERSLLATREEPSRIHFFTTGSPDRLRVLSSALLGGNSLVTSARWDAGRLLEANGDAGPLWTEG